MDVSTRSIAPDALVYGVRTAGDPQISPDGSRIVYTLKEADREKKKSVIHLWLCDRDGGNARRLSQSGDEHGFPRWSPDGAWLAFVSNRVAAPAKRGIFVLPVGQPGEARELTTHNQDILDLAWSPDGRTIAYTTAWDPDNPNEEPVGEGELPKVRVTSRLDYKWDGRGYLGDVRRQVWIVNVATGERRRLTGEPVDHDILQWAPDARSLAISKTAADGWNKVVAILDVVSGEITPVGGSAGTSPLAVWSPAGDQLLIAGDPENTYQPDFYLFDVDDGTMHRLTDDLQILPAPGPSNAAMAWLDERRVLVNAAREGRHGLYELNVEDGQITCLVRREATSLGMSLDAGRRYLVQTYSAFDAADEIAVHDLQVGTTRVVTGLNDALVAEAGPPGVEAFTIERGGFSIESWLLTPAGFDPARRYPVVVMIHGGPNSFFGPRFVPLQQLLVSQGYLVVLPNPRGSTSYGREFTMQVLGDRGGEDYLDLMAVVDEIAGRPYVDSERIGIYGYSYGGFMTAWMIGQTDRFKACVCGAPSVDLESQFGTSDIGWHYDTTQYRARPHERPEWFRAHSPLTYAHRATTPTLLMVGESDLRCPPTQSEELFVALKKAGCEVVFVRYPGMAHGFVSDGPPPYREDFLTRTLGWFDRYLD